MPLHHTCYDIETTCYITSDRIAAAGSFILAELDCTVTVSEDIDDGHTHYIVEAIDFGTLELDGTDFTAGVRSSAHCKIDRPDYHVRNRKALGIQSNADDDKLCLWRLLTNNLDMQHIAECVASQKENHF